MERPWESVLTLSVVHFMAFPECMGGEGPIAETLTKLALDDFFGAVEITWIKDAKEREQVRRIAEQSRLKLGYGAQPTLLTQKLSLNDLNPGGRRRAIEHMKACIDEAAELGCRRVAFLTGPDPGDADRERALDLLADSVRELCRYGQDKGIALTLETFDRDVDKKALLGPSDLAAQFAARIRADFPDFGLLYDLSHMPLLNESPIEALSTLQEYLVHIHVGNCVKVPGREAYGDQHPRFGFPGGENDVPELVKFLQALFQIGYLRPGVSDEKPWVGFEVKPAAGESSDLILANTKRAWRQAWARIQV
ncbi:MAG: sugar phosphate isomerase/epimerase [Anaerolineae bacterium]|nr:sugar phosphate isomerase/epimerase [Anaerolineae bacterium]